MKQKSILIASLLAVASVTFGIPPGARCQWIKTGTTSAYVNCFTQSGNNLFAGTRDSGVVLTTNDGASWTKVNTGLTNNWVRSIVMSDTNVFAGTISNGVFLSSNNGTSWTAANVGMATANVGALAIIGTHLFAGVISLSYSDTVGVFLSTNNGTNWTPTSLIIKPTTGINTFAVIGSYLFTGDGNLGGIHLSTDNGTSWTAADTGLGDHTAIAALAVSGTNLIAAASNYDGDGGIFLSTDSGANWTATLTNETVDGFAVSGTNLFASTNGDGVFLSTDNGARWTPIDGLTATTITALAVTGTNLIAGTNGKGAWRRPLSDFGISAVAQTQATTPEIQSYPNPFSQRTTITFTSEAAGYADVRVVNLLGVEVAHLFSGTLSAGEHSFVWYAKGIALGMYECMVRMDGQVQRTPMIVSR